MFGALSDVASEVDALRAEIGGLQWSLARARGEGDNYFRGVDAHTGMYNVPFLALSLPIGSLVDVTGEDGRVEAFSCGSIRGVTSRSLAGVSGSMSCVHAPHVV